MTDQPRNRNGRPRVTIPRQDQDRFIQRVHLRERFRPSTTTAGGV